MDLIDFLKNFGLNEKEAKVYLSSLQLGKASAYALAKHSGLKRSTTYTILDELIEKGVIKKEPKAKVMQYMAIGPEELLSLIESKLIAAREAIPLLKALRRGRQDKVNVVYYEGLESIKEMYRSLLNEKPSEVMAFYAHARDASAEFLKYADELSDQFRRKNIRRRGISTNHQSINKYLTKSYMRLYNSITRVLSQDKYDSNISIEIYKNYTQIFSHRYLQAIVIENPDIARVMRQIFELVWEQEDFIKLQKG